MASHIIDNKRIDLTIDEWNLYQKIVASYTSTSNRGEDLFIDLFETNEQGIITFLKPPSKRQTTLEVFLFLVSIMVHQHLRQVHAQVDQLCLDMKK
jgi:hypothetical protein